MAIANEQKIKPKKSEEQKKAKKEETWLKPRHKLVRNLLACAISPYSAWKYGVKAEKFEQQNGRQYLVLFNHQTAFDQFFVGASFDGPIYYLASEDIFSKGWVSSLIRYLVAPIPIKKQTSDIRAIKNCLRVAKEGGTIALAPEGNRTYSGKTEFMLPTIAFLAKKLGLPIALYRIEGGYGVHPRWSDVVRKGSMRGYVSKVIEPEEYKNMSTDELFAVIKEGLYVNEANADHEFLHDKRAEYLERAVYVCPDCGLSTFESNGNEIECMTCHKKISYETTTELKGVGFDFPFRFVNDWYEYQQNFVRHLDLAPYTEVPMYRENANLSEVIVYKDKILLEKNASVALYGNRIVIGEGSETERVFPFETSSAVTVLGKNKLNIYFDGKIYQLKGSPRFNALKYVNIYNHFKNIEKGDPHGEFLGL
jgi:1-acyl-sn-glycerol-3-phosphate acyltransferase